MNKAEARNYIVNVLGFKISDGGLSTVAKSLKFKKKGGRFIYDKVKLKKHFSRYHKELPADYIYADEIVKNGKYCRASVTKIIKKLGIDMIEVRKNGKVKKAVKRIFVDKIDNSYEEKR